MNRDKTIDSLRGFAMLLMILTHVTAWYRKIPLADTIWDLSNFSVPIFLFCSMFLFFIKPFEVTAKNFVSYFKKRILRFLVPYYIYLLFFIALQVLFGDKKLSLEFVYKTLMPWGGPDSSWLVTLFIYLTILAPLVSHLFRKYRRFFYLLGAASLASTVYFMFEGFKNYRLIMWLPWLMIVYFTFYFVRYIGKSGKRILMSAAVSFFIFFALRIYLNNNGESLYLFDNKYPPNLYHLAYGIGALLISHYLTQKKLFEKLKLEKILFFFSLYSYPIYFIHNLVIYSLNKMNIKFDFWVINYLVVVGLSALIQITINEGKRRISTQKLSSP